MEDKDYRTIKVTIKELKEGFKKLNNIGPCITIFGSAVMQPTEKYYKDAIKIGNLLGNLGFNIVTGAGPGIMEAANRGAEGTASKSVGLNIELPSQQKPNSYLDILINFKHFYSRKIVLVKYASGIIAFPGGFGTIDELFEVLTLVQTKKIKEIPVVLYGENYWRGLYSWLYDKMYKEGRIGLMDLEIFKILDTPDDAVNLFKKII